MTEFDRPRDGDAENTAPIGGVVMMVAGLVHAGVGVLHGMLFTLGIGVAFLDPELQREPLLAAGVIGAAGLCFLTPDVVSLALGALLILFGHRTRTQLASPVSTGLAVTGFLWGLTRMGLDVMTCSCSTLFLYMLPMVFSLVAVVFLARQE